ncbi:Rieske domain-containing protein-like [Glandiceps talaboti]
MVYGSTKDKKRDKTIPMDLETGSTLGHGDDKLFVCSLSDLQTQRRKVIEVNGRTLVIFYHNGDVFALDKYCYHAGGPLEVGDIEDIAGVSCIICPWHKYKISLATGEGYYQSIDPKQLHKPAQWRSKGVKQRTHHVTIQDDQVYVKLSDLSQARDSDYYYSENYKKIMAFQK